MTYDFLAAAMAIQAYFIALILTAVGAYVCIICGGYVVGWMVKYHLYSGTDDDTGMVGAGRAIGWAERTLIYLFILADAPTAIGLLVAAKSIMRLGDVGGVGDETDAKRGPDPRARSEYVIFGTLSSFAWAVTVAYIIRFIVTTWVL